MKNRCSIYIYIYDVSSLRVNDLTLILLTWRKWTPNNASKWQMGFNSAFKGLTHTIHDLRKTPSFFYSDFVKHQTFWNHSTVLCVIVCGTVNVWYFCAQLLVTFIPWHILCKSIANERSSTEHISRACWDREQYNVTTRVQLQGCQVTYLYSRSHWPHGLRRRSVAARLPRSWIWIPPGAWMFICSECCELSGRGLCDGLIARPEESYRQWCVVACDLETLWMRRPWPTEGCRAKNKQTNKHNVPGS